MIRELSRAEVLAPSFRRLLWLAAELDDDALDAIVAGFGQYTTLGYVDEEAGGSVVGMVAFHVVAGVAVIEYIAVAEVAQRRGIGGDLVTRVARVSGLPLRAETDDDAVEFYRARGFVVSAAAADPRWPGRARYVCELG